MRDHISIDVYPLDVTDAAAVEKTVADVETDAGPIDLAILNAGIGAPLCLCFRLFRPIETLRIRNQQLAQMVVVWRDLG